jgi:predicted protein tyrosine phosphatase
VAAGFLLKYKYNVDAIACSWEKNSPETLKMLFGWADHIIVMQEKFKQYVPDEYKGKIMVIDVGEDIWCNGLHPELLEIIDGHFQRMVRKESICST